MIPHRAQVQVTSLVRGQHLADLIAKLPKTDTIPISLLARKNSCGQDLANQGEEMVGGNSP